MSARNPPDSKAFALLKYCVPLLLFACFFHIEILNPANISWLLGGDWGQHFLGWHAFRHTPVHWPFQREYLLNYPVGISLINTDSNPLLALPLRLISRHLPFNFQYIGPWFLLCLVLQFHLAWRLVRIYAPGQWSALAGASLLTLLPTLYLRIIHDTLVAHWVILWALFIYFTITSGKRKLVFYTALLTLTALIHPYLLLMVFAIYAADRLRILAPLVAERRWSALTGPVLLSLVPFLTIAPALALAGVFDRSNSSGSGFGNFNMSLDAPFDPVRRDFLLALLRGGDPAARSYEGFQYLGAGILVLLALAVYLWRREPRQADAKGPLQQARYLFWPFLLLLLLAISNRIQLYDWTLLRIPMPYQLAGIFGIVRSSGRLVWPIAYTAVFLALTVLYRANRRLMTIGLSLAVLLQVIDMSLFAIHIRALTAAKIPFFSATPAPQWADLIRHADEVSFEPAQAAVVPAHQQALEEIAYVAVSDNVPVNSMYAARESQAELDIQQKEYESFEGGAVDPRHLYILINNCNVPAQLISQVRILDGIWIIPPAARADLVSQSPDPTVYSVGTTYQYSESSAAICQFDSHWAEPESGWTWSEGPRSSLSLPLASAPAPGLNLLLHASTYDEGKSATVLVNNIEVGSMKLGKNHKDYSMPIPAGLLRAGPNTITFLADPMTDARRASKHETRHLGIRLYTLRIE